MFGPGLSISSPAGDPNHPAAAPGVFTLENNLIDVVAIAHTKRNPGYWIGR